MTHPTAPDLLGLNASLASEIKKLAAEYGITAAEVLSKAAATLTALRSLPAAQAPVQGHRVVPTFDSARVAEQDAAIRKAKGEGMLEERRRWWQPEYPGQQPPTLVAWYRDELEDGLSGFDTKADRDAFQAGGLGPFIRRVTGNEFRQLPFAALHTEGGA